MQSLCDIFHTAEYVEAIITAGTPGSSTGGTAAAARPGWGPQPGVTGWSMAAGGRGSEGSRQEPRGGCTFGSNSCRCGNCKDSHSLWSTPWLVAC